ncbi:MAG: phosphoribosylformylglycinamidine synthase I [Candidatus Woesearchaeota archaeon]|jgi:phosphoribosylformylglycinamidine synthase|nr:phosphoribosylformylglycinamidine synthase I [Candidatus Woesearchaeota archaeon]MDP6265289.1 phosphoribosylformylglycinamidine synthase I [Candidatus Woesearchaeota archaeon]HJO01471.1 phosphoribosylformylglycinamidine synthase I [Candidatus Woesearchaeota archaeon]|tara:strand:- start:717 stop:1493 length:777 start_codon:yes stop_codon:yes gene_type:complete
MPKPKIAVMYFPGNNREMETRERCIEAGMDCDIVRWNTKENIGKYHGFIIPGGFSYEDRVRSGVIAAKEKIMEKIRKEAENRKPLLGICNGAQVLVETGLIPGLKNKTQMALAPNINPLVSGYYTSWVNIKSNNEKNTAFNLLFDKNEIIPIPVAHGEGRFTTKDKSLIKKLIANRQIIFRYCDEKGKVIDKFPINPNGSMNNIAAISNEQGNIMAIMPHPEAASLQRQIPDSQKTDSKASAFKIFESMKKYIESKII